MDRELVALAFGVVVGGFAQWLAIAQRYDKEWTTISWRKKFAMTMTGSIAAFVSGLYILNNTEAPTETTTNMRPYYTMWGVQALSAWGGARVLDALQNDLPGILRKLLGALMDKKNDK